MGLSGQPLSSLLYNIFSLIISVVTFEICKKEWNFMNSGTSLSNLLSSIQSPCMFHLKYILLMRDYQRVWLFIFCFTPFLNSSLIWRRHHYMRKAAKFSLCSSLTACEQWRFSFLCNGTSIFLSHHRSRPNYLLMLHVVLTLYDKLKLQCTCILYPTPREIVKKSFKKLTTSNTFCKICSE